jgi:hypothetical protein
VIYAEACPLCGTTTTKTREFTINGRTYVMRWWECIHPDPVDGHGVSHPAGPVIWKN